jgi:hypothetical protein
MTTTYFSSVGRDEQIPCLSIDSIHNLQAVVSFSFFVRKYGIDFIQQPAIFGLWILKHKIEIKILGTSFDRTWM